LLILPLNAATVEKRKIPNGTQITFIMLQSNFDGIPDVQVSLTTQFNCVCGLSTSLVTSKLAALCVMFSCTQVTVGSDYWNTTIIHLIHHVHHFHKYHPHPVTTMMSHDWWDCIKTNCSGCVLFSPFGACDSTILVSLAYPTSYLWWCSSCLGYRLSEGDNMVMFWLLKDYQLGNDDTTVMLHAGWFLSLTKTFLQLCPITTQSKDNCHLK